MINLEYLLKWFLHSLSVSPWNPLSRWNGCNCSDWYQWRDSIRSFGYIINLQFNIFFSLSSIFNILTLTIGLDLASALIIGIRLRAFHSSSSFRWLLFFPFSELSHPDRRRNVCLLNSPVSTPIQMISLSQNGWRYLLLEEELISLEAILLIPCYLWLEEGSIHPYSKIH